MTFLTPWEKPCLVPSRGCGPVMRSAVSTDLDLESSNLSLCSGTVSIAYSSPVLDWENLFQCGVEEHVFSRLSLATLLKLKATCRSWNQRIRQSKHFRELVGRRPSYLLKLYITFRWTPMPVDIAVHNPLRMEWLHTPEKWVCTAMLEKWSSCPNPTGKPVGGETGLLCFLCRPRSRVGFSVYVYNPLTQLRRQLPPIPGLIVRVPRALQMVPRGKSYQIIVMGILFQPQTPFAFYVYDSKSKAWTLSVKIQDIGFTENKSGTPTVLQVGPVLNGCAYYVLGHRPCPAKECSIWSYKVDTDDWKKLDVPAVFLEKCINFSIVGCGGKLVLVLVKGNLFHSPCPTENPGEPWSPSCDQSHYVVTDVDVWVHDTGHVGFGSLHDFSENCATGRTKDSWVHLGHMPKNFVNSLQVGLEMELRNRCTIYGNVFSFKSTSIVAAEECIYFRFDQFVGSNSVAVFDCRERSWSWLDYHFPEDQSWDEGKTTTRTFSEVHLFAFKPDKTAEP